MRLRVRVVVLIVAKVRDVGLGCSNTILWNQ